MAKPDQAATWESTRTPVDLGATISRRSWSEPIDWFDRILLTLLVGIGATFVGKALLGHNIRAFELPDLGPMLALGGLTFWLHRPASYTTEFGELGVMTTRTRVFDKKRWVLMFHKAATVDTELVRVISDGVSQIYFRTDVRFVWRDSGGAVVFAMVASVHEPTQTKDWNLRPDLDMAALDDLPPEHAAVFGFSAIAAFRAYQARTEGPFR